MKKILLAFLTVLGLQMAFSTIPNAQAHFLQISGPVGAVLHIDPDDDPIAKATSSFYFEFKDKDEKFVAQECDCLITVTDETSKNKTTIPQKDIGYIQTGTLIFKYVFPERGIYEVKMEGKPKDGGHFTPFVLTYDIRVDRESRAHETEEPGHLLHYLIFGGGILATIIVVIRDKRREMKV